MVIIVLSELRFLDILTFRMHHVYVKIQYPNSLIVYICSNIIVLAWLRRSLTLK